MNPARSAAIYDFLSFVLLNLDEACLGVCYPFLDLPGTQGWISPHSVIDCHWGLSYGNSTPSQ